MVDIFAIYDLHDLACNMIRLHTGTHANYIIRRAPIHAPSALPTGVDVGDVVEDLRITGLASDGDGVARLADGRVVFVHGNRASGPVATDDRVACTITHLTGTKPARAEAHRLMVPSPHRVTPPCPHFGTCGGCQYQHLSYPFQLATKRDAVVAALSRLGAIDAAESVVGPTLPAPNVLGYRTKVTFRIVSFADTLSPSAFPTSSKATSTKTVRLAMLETGSFDRSVEITATDGCGLAEPSIVAVTRVLREVLVSASTSTTRSLTAYDEETRSGFLRRAVLRGDVSGNVVLDLHVAHAWGGTELESLQTHLVQPLHTALSTMHEHSHSPLRGIVLSLAAGAHASAPAVGPPHVLFGEATLVERVAGLEFVLSPRAFFQVHRAQAETLVRLVQEAVQEHTFSRERNVLDLYCGGGLLGLGLVVGGQADRVIGLEAVAEAVHDARQNAERNGVADLCTFVVHDLDEVTKGCGRGAKSKAKALRSRERHRNRRRDSNMTTTTPASHISSRSDRNIRHSSYTEVIEAWAIDGDVRDLLQRVEVVVVDPPRSGLSAGVRQFLADRRSPTRLVYVSCNVSTQARDVSWLAASGWRCEKVTPVDLFPMTRHIETVAVLTRESGSEE